MAEIWKNIKGYENYYQVSNYGNVRSLDRIIKTKKGHKKIKGMIMKKSKNWNDYYKVGLRKNGNQKQISIHRLVAETFIPNPNNYPIINHKDGNYHNNIFSNLEWCTYSHNNKEAYKQKLKIPTFKGKFGKEHNRSKKIIQYDLNMNKIAEWYGSYEVERNLKYRREYICKCCNHKINTAYGYVWKYEEEMI